MTRLARDVTWMARLGAFGATVPAFVYGTAFVSVIRSDSHWLWSLAIGGLSMWSWLTTVDTFRTMYSTGRFDGAAKAWTEAAEECDAHHCCRICGGPHE